jgi:hypothetical protein
MKSKGPGGGQRYRILQHAQQAWSGERLDPGSIFRSDVLFWQCEVHHLHQPLDFQFVYCGGHCPPLYLASASMKQILVGSRPPVLCIDQTDMVIDHQESTAWDPYMYMGESTHPSATNRPTRARCACGRHTDWAGYIGSQELMYCHFGIHSFNDWER